MTENIPQTSASDRYEAARKALADLSIMIEMERTQPSDRSGAQLHRLIKISDTLIALTTPPSVGESELDAAHRIVDANLPDRLMQWDDKEVLTVAIQAYRAGVQAAHDAWEPADRPSQEQMLRWLGIEYEDTDGTLYIEPQHIDREEI